MFYNITDACKTDLFYNILILQMNHIISTIGADNIVGETEHKQNIYRLNKTNDIVVYEARLFTYLVMRYFAFENRKSFELERKSRKTCMHISYYSDIEFSKKKKL